MTGLSLHGSVRAMLRLSSAILAIAPLFAILLSTYFAHEAGVSNLAFLPNFIGATIGLALLASSRKWPGVFNRNLLGIAILALGLVFLTLFSEGDETVHRWLPLGPLRLNVSMALTPVVIFAISDLLRRNRMGAMALTGCMLLIFLLQPDAGQGTAFAAAAAVLVILDRSLTSTTKGLSLVAIGLAGASAWLRSDPLKPVEHVERILHLLAARGFLGAMAAVSSVLLLLAPIVIVALIFKNRGDRNWSLAMSFFAYLVTCFVVTEFGFFPVPIVGAGIAPVIGYYMIGCALYENIPQ
jgi:cell division protein FtsW (lipid II flippase)